MKLYLVGNAGSGKTTFAKEFAERGKLKHLELDNIIWDKSWKRVPDSEVWDQINGFIEKNNKWVVDGFGSDEICQHFCNESDFMIFCRLNLFTLLRLTLLRYLSSLFKNKKPAPFLKVINVIFWFRSKIEPELDILIDKKFSHKSITVKKLSDYREVDLNN